MDKEKEQQTIRLDICQFTDQSRTDLKSTIPLEFQQEIGLGSIKLSDGPVKVQEVKDDEAIKPMHCTINFQSKNGVLITPAYKECKCYVEAAKEQWKILPSNKFLIGNTSVKIYKISEKEVKLILRKVTCRKVKEAIFLDTTQTTLIGRKNPDDWKPFEKLNDGKPLTLTLMKIDDLFISRYHLLFRVKDEKYEVMPLSSNPTYICLGNENALLPVGAKLLIGSVTVIYIAKHEDYRALTI